MNKIIKKFLLIVVLFSFSCFVKALDEREVLENVEATSNIESIPIYGSTIEVPTFEVTSGSEARFAVSEGGWYRYNGENWILKTNGYRFNSGTWQYRTQLRIDGDAGSTIRLDNQTNVVVNGVEWTFSYCSTCGGSDFTYGYVISPNYVLEGDGELNFFEYEEYIIYNNCQNSSIPSFSVASTVEGGVEPYVFSKTSGPDWINVSEDGTVSGTPVSVGSNDNLVVRVTDANSDYKEITIPVGRTILPSELREEILNITATSNTSSIPVFQEPIVYPTFNIESDEGAYFANFNNGWYKKIGDNWKKQTGRFTAGVWKYKTEVRLDGEPAEIYKLSDNTTVIVDGIDWNAALDGIGTEFYALAVSSPEYIVSNTINKVVLGGNFQEPKIGDDIVEPIIWIESLNDDNSLINLVEVTAKWQYKTGEGFFDWEDATGKFEENKTYHISLMITLNSNVYDFENIANFPVTLEGYDLVQFQLNDKTIGEFIEFPVLKQINPPVLKIKNDNNKVILTWDNQDNVVKYKLYNSTDGKKYTKLSDVTENTYTEKGLTYGKTYYYKVKACDSLKCTDYSNIVSKKIKPNKMNLKIKSAGSNNIKLIWDKVSVSGYVLYRSKDNKTWTKIKTITDKNTLELNDKSLKVNKTYYYKARAYKTVSGSKIYGSYSDIVTTKTAPKKPTLELSLKNYNSMNIDIGYSKGTSKYRLEKSLDDKTYDLVEELPKEGRLVQSDQEVGKTYYYRVRACNSKGRCSSWVKASLKQTPKTPKITLTTTSKKVKITLNSVNGASGYQIYYSLYRSGKYTLLKELTSEDALEYTQKTKTRTTYFYKVRSYRIVNDKKVYSPYSSIKYIRSK